VVCMYTLLLLRTSHVWPVCLQINTCKQQTLNNEQWNPSSGCWICIYGCCCGNIIGWGLQEAIVKQCTCCLCSLVHNCQQH
jgi:hypothetical protein